MREGVNVKKNYICQRSHFLFYAENGAIRPEPSLKNNIMMSLIKNLQY